MIARKSGQFLVAVIITVLGAVIPIAGSTETITEPVERPVTVTSPKLIGQGVELHAQGIVIGDGEVLLTTSAVRWGATTSTRLDQFLKAMAQSFDALEFRVQTDFDHPFPETTAVANAFIKRAHDYGLKVALNYWRYPGTLNVPDEFRAKKIDDYGQVVFASPDDDHVKVNHIDKANPAALAWFKQQLQSGLNTIQNFDSFLIVEDKVSSWVQTDAWPQRVRYWDSPTYSQAALESFQAFQIIHDQALRLLPVDRAEFVEPGLTELAGPGDPIWSYWYEWRFDIFTNYLKAIKDAVRTIRPATKVVYMPWQRVLFESAAASNDDWTAAGWQVGRGNGVADSAIFGVSAKKIAKRKAVDEIVLEYGEDGTRWGWPMSLNESNAKAVSKSVKSKITFGSFIQLFNYSDHQSVIPELVVDELRISKKFNARTLIIYDVATLFEKSGRYNQELTTYWRAIKAWNFVRYNDMSLITMIRRELLKAKGKQLGLDPDRPGPPSMPAGVGAWYDRNGTIYITSLALRDRTAPFYIVADHWNDPLRTPDNWLEEAPDRGYVAIHRHDLLSRKFQVIDRYANWAPIGETAGICGLKGVVCTDSSWLFKPISWKKIDWTGLGWKP